MAPKSGNTEICDWQLQCSELKQRGAHLLRSGEWSDCSFVVDSERQVLVRAHKLILAMASPVFEAMFYGSMAAEGNKPIPISDVEPEAFKALLEYIYTDKININSIDAACGLCYVAKKYMLNHLVKECIKYLWPNITPQNACQVYEFARLLQENILMEKCLQVISLHTQEVLLNSSFNDIDYETMRTIFSLEHLNVDSELDLFEAAARHVKAQINKAKEEEVVNEDSIADSSSAVGAGKPEGGLEAGAAEPEGGPSSDDVQVDNGKKQTIRSAMEMIRFLTLSAEEFADGPAQSSLLTQAETLAVLMHLSSRRPHVALPPGINASREPRKQLIGYRSTRKDITPSQSFITFINQGFKQLEIPVPTTQHCRCSCGQGMMSSKLFAAHRFANCPIFARERLDFELICRVFKVDPYSEDTANNKSVREALVTFIHQMKRTE